MFRGFLFYTQLITTITGSPSKKSRIPQIECDFFYLTNRVKCLKDYMTISQLFPSAAVSNRSLTGKVILHS